MTKIFLKLLIIIGLIIAIPYCWGFGSAWVCEVDQATKYSGGLENWFGKSGGRVERCDEAAYYKNFDELSKDKTDDDSYQSAKSWWSQDIISNSIHAIYAVGVRQSAPIWNSMMDSRLIRLVLQNFLPSVLGFILAGLIAAVVVAKLSRKAS
jgi:hypothetical protein